MTVWIAGLAAYSVQLAVLVGVAALAASILRLYRPKVALRFWQGVFVVAIGWPAAQLWAVATPLRTDSATLVVLSFAEQALSTPLVTSSAIPANPAALLLIVLAAGALYRLTRVFWGLRALRAIRQASAPAASLASLVSELRRVLRVDGDIRFSTHVTSPATFGVFPATVLLPPSVERLPRSVQRAILCHELTHIRRRDWLAALAEEVWCALLWFHPAARGLANQLAFVRETVVDEATIASTGNRRAYAAALMAFAGARPTLPGAAALIGRRFERRIQLIAQGAPMDGRFWSLRISAAASVVVLATVVTTAAVPLSVNGAWPTQTVYQPGNGVTLPRVVREVKPEYTPEALQARIQGTVWLAVVVLPNGDVGDVAIKQSLDAEYGLDGQAVAAAKEWKFEPGTKDQTPVAVEITVEFTFTLK